MPENTAISGNEERVFAEKYQTAIWQALESDIALCESMQRMLVAIKNRHDFLETFSAREIIRINQVERDIPKTIERIQRILQLVESMNYEQCLNLRVALGRTVNSFGSLTQEMFAFTKSKSSKLLKYSPALMLVVHPYKYPLSLAKTLYRKMITKWWEKKRKK